VEKFLNSITAQFMISGLVVAICSFNIHDKETLMAIAGISFGAPILAIYIRTIFGR